MRCLKIARKEPVMFIPRIPTLCHKIIFNLHIIDLASILLPGRSVSFGSHLSIQSLKQSKNEMKTCHRSLHLGLPYVRHHFGEIPAAILTVAGLYIPGKVPQD